MTVLISANSDYNQLPLRYYRLFLTFQVLWSYSSWIMLLLFFYPDNDDLPEAFEGLKDEDRWRPITILGKFLAKQWLCGKSHVKYN